MMRWLLAIVIMLLILAGAAYWAALNTRAGQDFALDLLMGALAGATPPRPPADAMRVFMCGTASPLGTPDRAQACVAVIADGRLYLVDTGVGSAQTLQAHRVSSRHLDTVFITHFHSDHIGGLPDHNLGSWVAGRAAPLKVVGPPGVAAVVDGFNRAYELDRQYRTAHHGAELLPPAIGVMQAREIEYRRRTEHGLLVSFAPGVVHEADGLTVTAFVVDHSPVEPAFGYRFDYEDRSVVISGDAVVTATLEDAATDADLVIHDALSEPLISTLARASAQANPRLAKVLSDVLDYHAHTTAVVAMAERAGVRMLAFYHLVPAPRNALMEAIFMRDVPDDVVLAEDGMTFDLPTGSPAILVDAG